jgi:hypothetical protein
MAEDVAVPMQLQRCQAASGKYSPALSDSPMQASEMISWTSWTSWTPRRATFLEMLEEATPAQSWRLLLAVLVAFSHHQSSQIRGRQPYLFVRKNS